MSNTPARAVRVPDDLWDAALAQAQANGETVSNIIRQALTGYVQESVTR